MHAEFYAARKLLVQVFNGYKPHLFTKIDQIAISLDFLGDRHSENRGVKGLWNHISELIPEISKKLNWIMGGFSATCAWDICNYLQYCWHGV